MSGKKKARVKKYRPAKDWAVHPSFPTALRGPEGQVLMCPSGEPCPAHLADVFADESVHRTGTLVRSYVALLRRLRAAWHPFVTPAALDLLERTEAVLRGLVPWGICADCQGAGELDGGACPHCQSAGWIPLALKDYHL
jgi:hypothetical protein